MKGNWSEAAEARSGAAHARIWLIFNYNLIENERKLVWDSSGQNLIDLQLEFNRKWRKLVWDNSDKNLIDLQFEFNWKAKQIGLGQLRPESDRFSIRI